MNFTIEDFKYGTENEISKLVRKVFLRFIAPSYSDEGVQFFLDHIASDKILSRIKHENSYVLCARVDEIIIGIMEIRAFNHIGLLFVESEFHNNGAAKRLLNQAVSRCLEQKPFLKYITVKSSPYALPVYEKLGFVKTGNLETINGISFIPMQLYVGNYIF